MLSNAPRAKLHEILDCIGMPIFVMDIEAAPLPVFRVAYLNRAYEILTGFHSSGFEGKTPEECLDPSAATLINAHHRQCLEANAEITYEESFVLAGQQRWFRTTLTPIRDAQGTPRRMLGTTQDVTERYVNRRALREQGQWLHSILDGSTHAIIVTNRDGIIRLFNPAAEKLLGYRAEEVVGKTTPERFHRANEIEAHAQQLSREFGETVEAGFATFVEKARRGLPEIGEWTFVRKDGGELTVSLSVFAMRNEQQEITGYTGFARDITEQLRVRRDLERASLTDPLTGLYNRRHLNRTLQAEIDRSKRQQTALSVILLDIDHFKAVNDTYGHACGDSVLRELANRSLQTLRGMDSACRLGGEEFLMLLPDTTPEQAQLVAERLRQATESRPIDTTVGPISVTISIGVAGLIPGESGLQLLERADEALYEAKRLGRNRVEIAPTPPPLDYLPA